MFDVFFALFLLTPFSSFFADSALSIGCDRPFAVPSFSRHPFLTVCHLSGPSCQVALFFDSFSFFADFLFSSASGVFPSPSLSGCRPVSITPLPPLLFLRLSYSDADYCSFLHRSVGFDSSFFSSFHIVLHENPCPFEQPVSVADDDNFSFLVYFIAPHSHASQQFVGRKVFILFLLVPAG